MRIAVMQPYFIPYAGYFRLIAQSDLFVIYDCVQFPRRGWVHRNKLTKEENGEHDWITLNLKKAPQDVKIKDLQFAEDAEELWQQQITRFPVFREDNSLVNGLKSLSGSPIEFVTEGLRTACEIMTIPFNIEFSSSLNLSDNLKGQDRIMAITKHFAATEYLNASGGTELYNRQDFTDEGIELEFLPQYHNDKSILERLTFESPEDVARELS